MKRILVLSDSHGGMVFMRYCVERVNPDVIVHLGDYYDDSWLLHEEYRTIPMICVAGNCDRWRTPPSVPEVLIDRVLGVDLLLTHGHRHNVKWDLSLLTRAAQEAKVQAVLYGHTHEAYCRKDGNLWILNPGACGSWGGSAGIVEVEQGKILRCFLFQYGDEVEKV